MAYISGDGTVDGGGIIFDDPMDECRKLREEVDRLNAELLKYRPKPQRCCDTCKRYEHAKVPQSNGRCRWWPESLLAPLWVHKASNSMRRMKGHDCECMEARQ
jgi:hypothetical protein